MLLKGAFTATKLKHILNRKHMTQMNFKKYFSVNLCTYLKQSNKEIFMDCIDTLVFNFFKVFSRMEYALKEAKIHRGNGRAEANWNSFAKKIHRKFDCNRKDDKKLDEAVRAILDHPPKVQVVEDGKLKWSDNQPNYKNETVLILFYIRSVRNNLFHGAKLNDTWTSPARNIELLENSLVILNSTVSLHPEVQRIYETH